jgi:hypothetical protein
LIWIIIVVSLDELLLIDRLIFASFLRTQEGARALPGSVHV